MNPPAQTATKARQRVVKIRRDYNTWVATPDNLQAIGPEEDVFAVEAILYRA